MKQSELNQGLNVPDADLDASPGQQLAVLLRVEEAAERLGIARTKMFALVASGEVESVRLGRLRRVPVACLDEYVLRLRMQARRTGERHG